MKPRLGLMRRECLRRDPGATGGWRESPVCAGEEAGDAAPLYLLLILVAMTAAALRFFRLGDLSLMRKILESSIWFVVVMILGGSLLQLFLASIKTGSRSQAYSGARSPAQRRSAPSTSPRPVTAEDLSVLESEIAEVESPELAGLQGKPPEELAQAVRSLSGRDET